MALIGTVRLAPPDLAFYYSYAHSLLADADFHFGNQYDQFSFAVHELYLSPAETPANDWPMGTGVAWMPFLALGLAADGALRTLGVAPQGPWLIHWVVTYGATLLYSGGALWLTYLLCRRLGMNTASSAWGVLAMGLGSSYTYHLLVNSADSHPPAAFFLAAFFLLWLDARDRSDWRRAALAGICLGFSALIRPHNLIFALTPLLESLLNRKVAHRLTWRSWAALALGCGAMILPQLLAWQAIYGAWWAVPRTQDVRWLEPHFYEMLFSDFHGMISWSPLFGLGLLGLFAGKRWLPWLVPMLLTMYVHSCNIAWWAGGSFGNRRMVSVAPVLILGLAWLFYVTPKRWFKALAVAFGLWTLLLLIAEVGGTIRLDHYMTWGEILGAIPAGLPAGLTAFLTRPEWLLGGLARLGGVLAVLLFLGACAWLLRRARFSQRWKAALAAVVALNLLCLAAVWRTPEAAKSADLSDYPSRDRFAWVIYFEGGFYHLKKERYSKALEWMVAGVMAEPRHSQPWMYSGLICDRRGEDTLALHFFREALARGNRLPLFLNRYLATLNESIRAGARDPAERLNQRGILYAVLGEFARAESDFRQALRFDETHEAAQANLEQMEKRTAGAEGLPLRWE